MSSTSNAALPVGLPHGTWLALLRDATPTYAAQPYQHLAAVPRTPGCRARWWNVIAGFTSAVRRT